MTDENRITFWAEEARKILENPEEVYDLAGKRLAMISTFLQKHFSVPEHTFRVAVVGKPNLGKTTYSYSCSGILKTYQVPSTYVDLDVYTKSGLAISGKIPWEERPKKNNVTKKDVAKVVKEFENASPGIIFGDFAGLLNNPYHKRALKNADLAIILTDDALEKEEWIKLCYETGVTKLRILQSKVGPVHLSRFPQIGGLEREAIFSSALVTSATSILEEAAQMTGAPSYNYEGFFSAPELIVLQEHLDLFFSIQVERN